MVQPSNQAGATDAAPQRERRLARALSATAVALGVLALLLENSGPSQHWAAGAVAGLALGMALSAALLYRAMRMQQRDRQAALRSFEALFESAPVPMSCSPLGSDGLPEGSFWNHSWFELFGHSREIAQGRQSTSFRFWPDEAQRQAFVRAASSDAGVQTVEARLRCADGQERSAIVCGRVIERDGRRLLLTSYQDLSEQRRLDAARRAAESRLRELGEMVESANDAMMLIDEERILECNRAAQQMFGLQREQLIGLHPAQLSPLQQDNGRDSYTEAQLRLADALLGKPQRFLWRHVRDDGSHFVAEVTLNPVHADEPELPAPQRYVAVVRDVSESQRAARALQLSEQRFRQLFEQAPVALALVAPEGRVIAINRAWSQLLGYQIDEVPTIGDWWRLAYPDPEYRKLAVANWQQGLQRISQEGGELHATELLVRCSNGESRHLLIGGAWIGGDLMASFHDVSSQRTAQAQLEALNSSLETRVAERTQALSDALDHLRHAQTELVRAEKLASLGALVAGVAHELNTPIGNAVMVASTQPERLQQFQQEIAAGLRRSTLERFIAESREANQVLERNLYRASELLNSFKQVAVDQSSYQRRSFELAEVLHELRLTLSPTLRHSRVDLQEEAPAGLRMDSYPGPLTQVLMNVVNNAVVHAFEGREGRQISIRASALGEDRVRLVIADNGCGIAPEHLPRVFDPFFTTKLGRGGSGLGLHIVYSLCTELLGGSVRLDSQPGQGCSVTLELPLRAPAAAEG